MIAPCMSAWTTVGLCHELNTLYIFHQIQQSSSWQLHLPSALVEPSACDSVVKETNLWFELYTSSQVLSMSTSAEATQNYSQQHDLK